MWELLTFTVIIVCHPMISICRPKSNLNGPVKYTTSTIMISYVIIKFTTYLKIVKMTVSTIDIRICIALKVEDSTITEST